MKLLTFDIDLYRAPSIYAVYLLESDVADALLAKLREQMETRPDREMYLGELEGKHSNTYCTPEEVLECLTISEDASQIAAFRTLFPKTHEHRVWNSQTNAVEVKGHWIGSFDIIGGLEESLP